MASGKRRDRRERIGWAGFALPLGLLLCVCVVPGPAWPVGNDGADGRFERRDSYHFTLYQDVDLDEASGIRGSRQFEQEILRQLESAYDRLDALLDLRPDRKIDVYIWDPGIFDQRFSGLFRFPAAGFYGGAIHIRGDERVTPALVQVLHHELVHAGFDAAAPGVVLPAWMNEGIAEWFEARAFGQRSLTPNAQRALAQVARQGALFSLADLGSPSFGGFPPNAAALAYLESYGFIDHLVQTHGERDLVQFWKAVVDSHSLERGARRAYRSDLEDLERDFRRSLVSG